MLFRSNLQINDEVSYIEPETLFKEINTLNIVTELDIKEPIKEKSYDYNEQSFTHEMYKSDSKSLFKILKFPNFQHSAELIMNSIIK